TNLLNSWEISLGMFFKNHYFLHGPKIIIVASVKKMQQWTKLEPLQKMERFIILLNNFQRGMNRLSEKKALIYPAVKNNEFLSHVQSLHILRFLCSMTVQVHLIKIHNNTC